MVKSYMQVANSQPFQRIVRVRVFAPGNRQSKAVCYRAPRGKTINHHELIVQTLANLEQQFPLNDYEVVAVHGGFNFVSRGLKANEISEQRTNGVLPTETREAIPVNSL